LISFGEIGKKKEAEQLTGIINCDLVIKPIFPNINKIIACGKI